MAKKWTKEEEDLLRELYLNNNTTLEEIGVIMGRSAGAVKAKKDALKITKRITWTKESEQILQQLYLEKRMDEIAVILNRTEASLRCKASELGLTGKSHATRIKTHEIFTSEVAVIAPDLQLLEKYVSATARIAVKSKVCGHEWSIVPKSLLGINACGKVCPVCQPRYAKHPDTFEEEVSILAPDLQLLEKYVSATARLAVKNKVCGHEWAILPTQLLIGVGIKCPVCLPGITKPPEIFEEEVLALAPNLQLLERYTGAKTRIMVNDKTCGHEWSIQPNNFLQGAGRTCPVCTPKGVSKAETTLGDFLAKYTEVVRGSRDLLDGKEIDIYLPEFKLGVEYNGLHWHSEEFKHKEYHLEKTELAASKGVRLIHVFEHENMEIVKSRLLSIIGKSSYGLRAGKTEVREIDFPREFLNTNHIQGAGRPTKTNLGLFCNDNLISVMTFGRPTRNREHEHELVRFCSLLDIRIRGGAGKLLKYYTTKYKPESILSYSDKRWSTGELYKALGFKYDRTTDSPNYFYTKSSMVCKRHSAQKNKLKELVPEFYDEALPEWKIMNNAGWFRVYDCGHDIWVWTPPDIK